MILKRNLLIFLFFTILIAEAAHAQDNIGLPFLKIGIGTRQAGMGDVFTGVGDDVNTIYWNPAGLGHIRRWQWSAAFNRWFADIYQASFLYAKQFRFIGSRKSTIGLFASYVGMPDWDATGGKEASVGANHLVAGISFAHRLDWISQSLAFGITAKYISTNFDTYSSRIFAGDFGLLFKPGRFKLGIMGLGLFDYGIFSCGISLLHYGQGVEINDRTSNLPQTWRVGGALQMGRYRSWSLLIASDVVKVQGQDWVTGVGTEIWWRNILGVRAGYRMNGEDLGGFSFGFGLRWDGIMKSLLKLPSRYGDAFELNLADVNYGEVLKQTYRGSISHYPVAPEPFLMDPPRVVSSLVEHENSKVTLFWEPSPDPDPFDEVNYYLMVHKDSMLVERSIRWIGRDMDGFLSSNTRDSLIVCESMPSNSHSLDVNEGGIYYWAVAAYDLAKHVRLAKRGSERGSLVDEFVVATHDIGLRNFNFTPTPWITTTPEQGTLSLRIVNEGLKHSGAFQFEIVDFNFEQTPKDTLGYTVYSYTSKGLDAGRDTTLHVPWLTHENGLHSISAKVNPASKELELHKENNRLDTLIVSVPKGTLLFSDSVEVMATGYDSTDVPVVPEVYFAPFLSQVDSLYWDENRVPPPSLFVLADRLKNNPSITIEVRGYIDQLSGEKDPQLADDRSRNVKNSLVNLGVSASQIQVITDHKDKVLGRRRMPADSLDAKWVMEQYRVVTFHVSEADQLTIFGPLTVSVDTTLQYDVPLNLDLVSPGLFHDWSIRDNSDKILLSDNSLIADRKLFGKISWSGVDRKGILVSRNQTYQFTMTVTDTLNRTFRNRPKPLYLREKRTLRRREIFGAAKFAQVEPVYQFYWDRLMDIAKDLINNPTMQVKFEGHACAIGSEMVNERLSQRRAQRFTQAFRDRVRRAFPNQYQSIANRIQSSQGYGENMPLRLKLKGRKEQLLGDNESPVGRYLNRRIMVLLYKEN